MSTVVYLQVIVLLSVAVREPRTWPTTTSTPRARNKPTDTLCVGGAPCCHYERARQSTRAKKAKAAGSKRQRPGWEGVGLTGSNAAGAALCAQAGGAKRAAALSTKGAGDADARGVGARWSRGRRLRLTARRHARHEEGFAVAAAVAGDPGDGAGAGGAA